MRPFAIQLFNFATKVDFCMTKSIGIQVSISRAKKVSAQSVPITTPCPRGNQSDLDHPVESTPLCRSPPRVCEHAGGPRRRRRPPLSTTALSLSWRRRQRKQSSVVGAGRATPDDRSEYHVNCVTIVYILTIG